MVITLLKRQRMKSENEKNGSIPRIAAMKKVTAEMFTDCYIFCELKGDKLIFLIFLMKWHEM